MSLRNQFVAIDQPAPKPVVRRPVTELLRAQIAAPPVTQPVTRQDVNTALDVTQSIAMPAPSTAPPRTATSKSVRSTPEAYRTYYRELMRKRRAALKLDAVALASVNAS